MIFEVDSKDLSRVLTKVCGIASTDSRDGQSHEVKISAKSGEVRVQAMGAMATMWCMASLTDGIDVTEEGSVCVPADAIQQTANLTKGRRIRIASDKSGVVISQSGDDKSKYNKVLLSGMSPEDWVGMARPSDEAVVFSMTKESLTNLVKHTAFCASQNRTKAPLTAVCVEVDGTGLRGTAYDMNKVSFYSDPETRCDGDISFMLHPESAKRLLGFFDDGTVISASVEKKRLLFSSGDGLYFGCVPEVGGESYPALDVHLVPEKTFSCTFKTADLTRAAGLLYAAAPKSVCEVTIHVDGTVTMMAEDASNKAIQRIKADMTDGDFYIEGNELTLLVGCYDLVEGIKAAGSEIVQLCSSQPKNDRIGDMFELRTGKQWRHIIFRSSYGTQKEE